MSATHDLYGNPIPPPVKCKHCGRPKDRHLAKTFNCPFGISRAFPNYRMDQFFEPPASKE